MRGNSLHRLASLTPELPRSIDSALHSVLVRSTGIHAQDESNDVPVR